MPKNTIGKSHNYPGNSHSPQDQQILNEATLWTPNGVFLSENLKKTENCEKSFWTNLFHLRVLNLRNTEKSKGAENKMILIEENFENKVA